MPRHNLDSTSFHRASIFDLLLFLLMAGCVWAINIIGQSSFPGSNFLPFFIRSIVSSALVLLAYYINYKFIRKNALNGEILRFKPTLVKQYLSGSLLGFILIAAIWSIIYLIFPFEVIRNADSKTKLITDIASYSLGNTLEELLFRGFLLLTSVNLFGKITGILFPSLLFGLFHLQATGLTTAGLTMVMTTFTMSLLFIAVIYYTKSIWTAVTLHITGNLLLHTLGFDATTNGLFQIRFSALNINGLVITLIYEIVVITFAMVLFIMGRKGR